MFASSKYCSTTAPSCSGLEDFSWIDHHIYDLLIWNGGCQQYTRLILTFNEAWNLQLTRARCQTGQKEVKLREHKFSSNGYGWCIGSEKQGWSQPWYIPSQPILLTIQQHSRCCWNLLTCLLLTIQNEGLPLITQCCKLTFWVHCLIWCNTEKFHQLQISNAITSPRCCFMT